MYSLADRQKMADICNKAFEQSGFKIHC